MRYVKIFCIMVLCLFITGNLIPVIADGDVYGKVIRFHVIAKDDSEKEQSLKLELRDELLNKYGEIFEACESIDRAEEQIVLMLSDMESFSEKFLASRGYPYSVNCSFGEEYYPAKNYEGFSLPAGTYRSLRVEIAEAEGENWWCVIFPSLCINSARAREKFVSAGFTGEQIKILTENDEPKYLIKFRIAEIFNEISRGIMLRKK
ncbi:MAG: stage II sporulation protein R [Ruminococcaceae bacterium]|nr:stage II sporulation protein R [Oscillospiraceae bacterium]